MTSRSKPGSDLPEHSPGAQALFRALSETDPAFVVFHEASEETIRSEVAAGRWECGFILHEDFETRYPAQYPGKLATMVRSRGGTLSPLLGRRSLPRSTMRARPISRRIMPPRTVLPPMNRWMR